jgi:hypothetical protein
MDTMTPVFLDMCDDRIADINPRSQRWLFGPIVLEVVVIIDVQSLKWCAQPGMINGYCM